VISGGVLIAFGIVVSLVVGIALLLAGVGFIVLALGALRSDPTKEAQAATT
jgi:hypothetical protein